MDYTIHFACTLPGEPGCGCSDGDFHGEHEFSGDFPGAIKEAKRISFETYAGDFRWWITDSSGKMVHPKK